METKYKINNTTEFNDSVIFKLPEDKDPCICIVFRSAHKAETTNKALFEKWSHDLYTITLYPTTNEAKLLNVMLVSPNNQVLYKNLNFDYHKLLWWLKFIENTKHIQFKFCHTYQVADKLIPVKFIGTKKLYVLTASSIKMKDESLTDLTY